MHPKGPKRRGPLLISILAVGLFCRADARQNSGSWKPETPRTWVDEEIATLEVPLADAASSPQHVTADYYYRIPVRPIFKTYPVYAPGKEPSGYIERVRAVEPEVVFVASRLKTEEDWTRSASTTRQRWDVAVLPLCLDGKRKGGDRHSRLWDVSHAGPARREPAEGGARQFSGRFVDLIRYAALNQGGDDLASFAGFIPAAMDGKRPDPSTQLRYSDEQLYALALYLYSLKPPANPNRFDGQAQRGQRIFNREGCATCHTPPLYTNNKLTPATVFTIPADHRQRFDVLAMSLGTDPNLTMKTRRGTGYYKVPSLKGVWYRSPFEHNGSVARLEDWFDPRRLRDDYVLTGFVGAQVKARAVRGHEFGLNLPDDDRRALSLL
jgi:mono/diheme cytochrome c family protein